MFDVLMFLLESYIAGDFSLKAPPESLTASLHRKGFRQDDILEALNWLAGLSNKDASQADPLQQIPTLTSKGVRVFNTWECLRLSSESRGFIMALEQCGILTSATRETVIERALALDIDYIEPLELKLIILMVLGVSLEGDERLGMLQEFILLESSQETMH